MTEEQFKKIVTSETLKEACHIFEVIYEGTNTVNFLKIQRLTSEFETIIIKDNETFTKFHSKLKVMVNSLYNMNEIIHEH